MVDPGTIEKLDGAYEFTGMIGGGGGGKVLKAHDKALSRDVALKVLAGDLGPRQVRRFFREARRTARLEHPHIVAVHRFGTFGGAPCVVMAYVPGVDLASLIAEAPGGRLAPERVAALGLQACKALAYAHSQAVVHRDIKPANMLVTRQPGGAEHLQLVDFGIAIDLVQGDATTARGKTSGTPEYMSPAQCEGARPSPADDLYSLGATLYEALTGVRPFDRGDALATMQAHLGPRPESVHAICPQVPLGLSELVMEALALDPAARPRSAEAMGERLAAYVRNVVRPALADPVDDLAGTAETLDPDPELVARSAPPPPATEAAASAPSSSRAPAGAPPVAARRWQGAWLAGALLAALGTVIPLAASSSGGAPGEVASASGGTDALAGELAALPDVGGLGKLVDSLEHHLGGRLAWGLPMAEARSALPGWTEAVIPKIGPCLRRTWGPTSPAAGRRKSVELVFGDGGLRMVYVRFFDHLSEIALLRALTAALGPPDERRALPEMTEEGAIWRRPGSVLVQRTFCSEHCWTGLRLGATLGEVL
ncbi:MAG: hypothetical protein CSA66_04330 [Proteobacteria bacterium]|nr:MAG: hypothetical protein CSA66_04330 [Pseudomonadota bacterium]